MTRGAPKAFTYQQLVDASPCVHSVHHQDCPSCIKHAFWYKGRMDGLQEAVVHGIDHAHKVTAHMESPQKGIL